MSHIKLLVSSLTNVGKTSLLSTLENALVIARDGKQFPLEIPHTNVPDFTSASELIDHIVSTVNSYEEKYDKSPEIVVIDSISKILLDIEGYVLEQVASFPYGKVNTEIKKVVDFIERDMTPNFDIILTSHALYSEDTSGYSLVNAGGSFGKKGGILSELDEAVFIELKGKKRIIHMRNSKMASRTTRADLPDSVPIEEFNLQKHVELLRESKSKAAKWTL